MTDEKSIDLGNVKSFTIDDGPYQSANCLFHFVKKLDYIKSILEQQCLKPWYVKENIEYLNLEGLKEIYIPMKCFCDINLHKLTQHINYYGNFGVAFSKKWGIENGVQPVIYANNKSLLIDEYRKSIFRNLREGSNDEDVYPLMQMMYIKPLIGMQKDKEENEHLKYYTDECEWRYIFDMEKIDPDFRQIYKVEDNMNFDTINKSLQTNIPSELTFKFEDIKYIILNEERDFLDVQQLIDTFKISQIEKYKLMSKIIIWDESKGDF